MIRQTLASAIALATALNFTTSVFANHGPGTSGGGSATTSGETLKQYHFELSLRDDYTQFENVSRAEAELRALKSGEFDGIDSSNILSTAIGFGITDDLQLSAQIGYYHGSSFIDAESEDGEAESSTADPEGVTDLAIGLKYRFYRGPAGNFAAIGGVIAPTGRDDVRLTNGEPLEPSSQPGTGAWAYQVGAAWSRFLTPRITADVSGIYTIRTPHDGFEVGDRLDLGVAVSYRLTESIRTFPNWSIFGEVNAVWLGKDDDGDEKNPNSGGWTAYFTPGVRLRWNDHLALTVAPSVPFLQELNGDQIEATFKLAATLSWSF